MFNSCTLDELKEVKCLKVGLLPSKKSFAWNENENDENDEKGFLFHFNSSFRSQDI